MTKRLKHKIGFYEFKTTQNEYGEMEKREVLICEAWCEIHPMQGDEKFLSKKVESSITHKLRLRYDKRVTSKMIIKYGNRKFEILSVISPYEAKRELVLVCKEVFESV